MVTTWCYALVLMFFVQISLTTMATQTEGGLPALYS